MSRAAWWTCALLALALAPPGALARIYHRCELARDLRALGVHPDHLSTWVCIAYHESRFDTAANNPHSGDHGIFQISELYWCGAGKACGLPCAALRDDDIADDLECALQVHEEHTRLQGDGFLAWVVYPQHCKQSTKKYLIDCDENFKNASTSSEGRGFDVRSPYSHESRYRIKTDRTYSNNPNIDNLLPPFLAITSIFRGSYGKVLDHNKINGVDWYNYKYDKVDELKLPGFGTEAVGKKPATSTSTTTTTTTTTYLPPIKPWRYIETNQFRKKASSSNKNAIKTTDESSLSEKTTVGYSTYKPTTMTTRVSENMMTGADISPEFKITTVSYKSPVTPASTIKPMNITNAAYKWPTFTASYKSRTSTYRPSTITYGSSTGSTNDYLTSTTGYTFPSSTPTVRTKLPSFVFTFPTKKPATVSTSVFTFPTRATTVRSPNFSTTTVKPPTTTIKPTQRTWSPWFTFAPRINTLTSTTTKSPQYARTSTTPRAQQSTRSFQTSTTQKPSVTTVNVVSKTRNQSFFTTSTTPKPKSSTTTTQKPTYTTTTTQKPTLYSTTQKSTLFTTSKSQRPTTQRTSRSTQNIFDLYLNPTKPPKLRPFSFSSKDDRFKVNIFHGGTTTTTSPLTKNSSGQR